MGVGTILARGIKFIKWDTTTPEVFLEQVKSVCIVEEASGCWLWNYGNFNHEDRYPEIMINRKRDKVARWVLFITTGVMGDVSRHFVCDRVRCCNPDHLCWGSVQDNVQDRVLKNRSATGDKSGFRKYPEKYRGDNHWTRKSPEKIKKGLDNPLTGRKRPDLAGGNNPSSQHPERLARGEKHGRSIFTDNDVLAIRERYSAGTSVYRLSKNYNCNKRTIKQIVEGKTWKHLL